MNIIYKYQLQHITHLDLPIGAQILTAQMQDDKPVLWVLFDQLVTETEPRRFVWVATGVSFDFSAHIRAHVATLQNSVGMVVHLFEVDL